MPERKYEAAARAADLIVKLAAAAGIVWLAISLPPRVSTLEENVESLDTDLTRTRYIACELAGISARDC